MNKGLKVRRGAGSFNKSVMFVTAPSGSTVTMQNMVRSDNLATDVQYQEASAKDQSCVTIKQCGEVSKGDRVKVSLEVTASKDAVGYWASESGLITDKREVNLKSGKQTVTLDITASGNLSLDTKFFCKGDDSDATITAANLQLYKYTAGTTIKTATEKNGVWRFNGLDIGLWLIKAEKESETPATQEFEIIEFGVYRITMAFRITPDFTYTGDYEVVDNNDNPIDDFPNWKEDWKIRFLTSGDFIVTDFYAWNGMLDVFLVGAGSGGQKNYGKSYYNGGNSGYTLTGKTIKLEANRTYAIEIGSGGPSTTSKQKGGDTSAFGLTASGGIGPGDSESQGGKGGSGGGAGSNAADGASDGESATGIGQREEPGPNGESGTTREFGEPDGKLYAGGGGGDLQYGGEGKGGEGGGGDAGENGETNTGGGGGANAIGGSGIVVIRNTREVA